MIFLCFSIFFAHGHFPRTRMTGRPWFTRQAQAAGDVTAEEQGCEPPPPLLREARSV
jgi:hypothetical protein